MPSRRHRSRRARASHPAKLLFIAACGPVGLVVADTVEHEIATRANQWVPAVLFIEPGDTVTWRGMSGHETALIEGMGPEDAMRWRSELNEEGFRVTFTEPGAYIYKCDVHLPAGMVGAIVVGEPSNVAEIDAAVSRLDEERASVARVVARMKRMLRARR